jgi:hypothetical protein
LSEVDRIAIWNKAKIIIAITMAIWLADISVLLYGKYLLQITVESFVHGNITGAIRVNFLF